MKKYSHNEVFGSGAKISTLVICVFVVSSMLWSACAFAEVIFQDNFDANCTGNVCYSRAAGWCTEYYPAGWDQWYCEDSQPVTAGGATHYGGEISSPGRGGTGKSFKVWRYGTAYPNYTGALLKTLSSSAQNLYVRWYMKIPTAMRMNGCHEYQKLWRFNTSRGQIYLNINNGWQNGVMQVYDETEWTTILNNSQLLALMDGNWHCVEIQLGLNNSTLRTWIDGVLTYSNTSKNWHGNTNATFNNYFQHFGFGNRGSSCSWQLSWQAAEFDDLVLSTTYVGPDGGGGDDNIPPAVSIISPGQTSVSGLVAVEAVASDNVSVAGVQFKLNGIDLQTEVLTAPYSITWDTTSVANGSHTITAVARDKAGNQSVSSPVTVTVNNTAASILFSEGFNDNNVASRGWFDDTSVDIDTSVKYSGTGSLRLAWGAGQTNPPLVVTMRKDFTATDSLYVSMYWRFNNSWVGSGVGYHPHLIYILSDLDDHWGGLANNYLDTYIETSNLTPRLIIQDGQRINYSYGSLPNNLTSTTENRDVAGCNGCLTGSDCGDSAACYHVGGGVYWNGRFWNGSRNFALNTWHKVEAYFKMNSISGGRAVADGIMWMKVDGNYVINKTKVVYRTNQYPTMKWRTFVIAPWIGDGSPQAQTMWIDELVVANGVPGTPGGVPPSSPAGLRVVDP